MKIRKSGFYFDTYRENGSCKVGFVIGYDADFREATVWLSFFCWKVIAGYYFGEKDGDTEG